MGTNAKLRRSKKENDISFIKKLNSKELSIHLLKNHSCENCKHSNCSKGELCSNYQPVDDHFHWLKFDDKDSIRDFFQKETKIICTNSTIIEGIKAIYSPTNTLFYDQKLSDSYSIYPGDTLNLNIESGITEDLMNKVIDAL